MAVIPLGGWLSDKHGRARVLGVPAAIMMAVAYPIWLLFKLHNAWAAWFAQLLLALLMATYTGALTATLVALFPPEYRCLGLSIGHNISMAAFGGTAPLLATAIIAGSQDIAAPAALLIITGGLSVAGAFATRHFRVDG